MSAQTIQRVSFVMIFCLSGPALVYANDSKAMDIVYKQHWKPPDTPPTYGKGEVIAAYPSVGEPASAIKLTIQLADSGYTNEWNNGGNSEWDLVTSMDGINWAAEQVRIGPATFTDHGDGGAMTVNLSSALDKTGGQEKVKQFELYGTCWGMNVSPKTPKGAHFVVYGKVTWQTDNAGVIQKCVVEFLGADQARGLLSQSYFPQRKVDYDRPLPAVTAYAVNRSTLSPMACSSEVHCCPPQLNCVRKRFLRYR
jgi:hypothetical protein